MHILATFATLCCQTRWPRNHSCTTQEHVSFFRTFSGTRQKPTGQNRTFSEISTFSRFCRFCSKSENSDFYVRKKKIHVRTCSQNNFTHEKLLRTNAKHRFTILQMCKRQMCKCANVQKTDVHKMRKSAAQIFFQMQKCTNLQIDKSALCNFSVMQVLCFRCEIISAHK